MAETKEIREIEDLHFIHGMGGIRCECDGFVWNPYISQDLEADQKRALEHAKAHKAKIISITDERSF